MRESAIPISKRRVHFFPNLLRKPKTHGSEDVAGITQLDRYEQGGDEVTQQLAIEKR